MPLLCPRKFMLLASLLHHEVLLWYAVCGHEVVGELLNHVALKATGTAGTGGTERWQKHMHQDVE
jgi:hypothetical protein